LFARRERYTIRDLFSPQFFRCDKRCLGFIKDKGAAAW
jgi:hypothetical protein